MFSLKPCDELVFATTSQPETNLISFASAAGDGDTKLRQRRPERRNECNIRRGVMHRDYERKRRAEMSKLYVSLGALLPLQPNKWKISVCDQMEEAANYIKQMHNKIQLLRSRRDELNKLNNGGSKNGCTTVSINQFLMNKFEILINVKNSDFELSRILAELREREIDVVSCVSTRTGAGFLHKIEIEARDMTSHDVSMLHERLTNAMKY